MGIFPGVGTFGGLLGISGGGGIAKSSAGQSATREMTASSLQSIVDRTQQAASVVQIAACDRRPDRQPGRAGAGDGGICRQLQPLPRDHDSVLRGAPALRGAHAARGRPGMPLRPAADDSFRSREVPALAELAREASLPTRPPARLRCRRARSRTRRRARRRTTTTASASRGGTSRNRRSSRTPASCSLEFFFFNTEAEKIDEDLIRFFNSFGISLDAFRDKQITDEQLAQAVGPRTVEFLLDAFTVRTDDGTDLRLDATLNSSFRQNAPLRVSLRQSANTPRSVARDRIDAINVNLDLGSLSSEVASSLTQFGNKYMKIRLRSGALRYRTANLSGTLFDGRMDNDIFAGGDGAFIPTPLSSRGAAQSEGGGRRACQQPPPPPQREPRVLQQVRCSSTSHRSGASCSSTGSSRRGRPTVAAWPPSLRTA